MEKVCDDNKKIVLLCIGEGEDKAEQKDSAERMNDSYKLSH